MTLEIERIEAALKLLDRERDELMKEYWRLQRIESAKREADSGNPQVGDLVVIRRTHGDAKEGDLGTVRELAGQDFDHEPNQMMVGIDMFKGSITLPLGVMKKVDSARGVELFKLIDKSKNELWRIVYDLTKISPNT